MATLILNQNYVSVGLGTQTYTVPTTGNYNVQVQLTEVPPSGLAVVINQNGSAIYTAPAISVVQQIGLQFKVSFTATAADVITVVLSSSAAIDSQLNNVKSNISIGQGL